MLDNVHATNNLHTLDEAHASDEDQALDLNHVENSMIKLKLSPKEIHNQNCYLLSAKYFFQWLFPYSANA